MSEKPEDKSEESKKNHIKYYKSLTKTIENIQNEKQEETDPRIIKHLDDRIEAMNLDKKRIKDMFPETGFFVVNGYEDISSDDKVAAL